MMTTSTLHTVPIGIGIDTSRYGHYVTFLSADLQPAAAPLQITETRAGYDQLVATFHKLKQRHPAAVFHIRLDAAGQYAANLEAFLHKLPFEKTVSIGDPVRNKNYRVAHFPKRKSDAVESYCVARFAVIEQPKTTSEYPAELLALREMASRLEAQTREVTRHVNQLHSLLARVFPELATLISSLAANWVLQLLAKYPTPAKIARARLATIREIPRISQEKAQRIHQAAQTTIASLTGDIAEQLVKSLVRQIQASQRERREFERMLIQAYEALPFANRIDTIIGIGVPTAAVLTAKIISIDRFDSPERLVGYFGIFPQEVASGIDADGNQRPRRHTRMSKKGNDLVRHYLYNAAMSACRYNPACRALYQRLKAKGVSGNAALGHVMRKLLHLVFAVWKSAKPFDPNHYPWEQPHAGESHDKPLRKNNAAGHKQETSPERQVVTAAEAVNVSASDTRVNAAARAIPSLLRSPNSEQASEAPPERIRPKDFRTESSTPTKERNKNGVITPDTT
ncbi:MAG: IS110 family transposase [Planctomycetes bacterium]|nr:IS110 family transposase [Planctomycetota bacterium]